MHKLLFSIAALVGVVLAGGALGTSLFAEDPDLFSQLDANKDGFISQGEVEEGKKPLFERLVRVADENGDKKLSKEEFAKGTQKSTEAKPPLAGEPGGRGRPGGGAPNIKEFLSRLDKNGDGKISKEEAPERMKENFDRLDANKDGNIDAEEFLRSAGGRPGGTPPSAPPAGGGEAKAAEEIFTKHDANSDGKLTKDEIPDEQKEMFQRILDRAGDGVAAVTKEQFVRAIMAQRQFQNGRPPDGRPGEPGRPGAGPMVALPVLKALDADGDGEISKSEIEGAAKALSALDKNGDGKLSRDEILPNFTGSGNPGRAGAEGRPGQPGQPGQPGVAGRINPEEMFRRLKEADKNGDGKISKDEAPDRMKENFDRIDANGDGQLDESEIKTMFERLREAAGRRPEAGRPEGRPERKAEERQE